MLMIAKPAPGSKILREPQYRHRQRGNTITTEDGAVNIVASVRDEKTDMLVYPEGKLKDFLRNPMEVQWTDIGGALCDQAASVRYWFHPCKNLALPGSASRIAILVALGVTVGDPSSPEFNRPASN